jgi:hypothetical protein
MEESDFSAKRIFRSRLQREYLCRWFNWGVENYLIDFNSAESSCNDFISIIRRCKKYGLHENVAASL